MGTQANEVLFCRCMNSSAFSNSTTSKPCQRANLAEDLYHLDTKLLLSRYGLVAAPLGKASDKRRRLFRAVKCCVPSVNKFRPLYFSIANAPT